MFLYKILNILIKIIYLKFYIYNKIAMTEYMCFRCGYKTKFRGSMKNHFNRIKKCEKNIDAVKYTDEEIFMLSFIPYKDSLEILSQNNKPENITLNKPKEEILEEVKNIHLNKSKTCKYCKLNFAKLKDLRNHILTSCKKIYVKDNTTIIDNSVNTNINNTNIYENSINYNTNNIININLFTPEGKKNIISFDDNWNISHLDDDMKLKLFLSTVKYSKLLEYILDNDKNINVLLEKNSETGFIYNNEKIEKMKVSEIIEKSISKLHNHLKDFSTEIMTNNNKFVLNNNLLKKEDEIIDKKYQDFCNDKKVKENVETMFSEIYLKYDDRAKENFANVLETQKIEF
jgi:hypothetical protein